MWPKLGFKEQGWEWEQTWATRAERPTAGREHRGKRKNRVFSLACESNSILHLMSPLYCSSPFVCLTTSFCNLVVYKSSHILKNQDPHHSKFYMCRSLEHQSIDKCPWPSKECTNIIYTLVPEVRVPLPIAKCYFFTAVLPDAWRHIFHQWATFIIEWKDKKVFCLLLPFNQQNFWMQMNESPLWWLAAWVFLVSQRTGSVDVTCILRSPGKDKRLPLLPVNYEICLYQWK